MLHSPALALVLGLVDIALIVWIWQTLFPTWGDVFHAVGYWMKPDWLSMIEGDWLEDSWETGKLFLALALTALLVYAPVYAWYR